MFTSKTRYIIHALILVSLLAILPMQRASAAGETTILVSVASSGIQGNASSWNPSISANGRYIAFESHANNLVSGDFNDEQDIFLYDTYTSTTTIVSVDSFEIQRQIDSYNPSISADGHYVAFDSEVPNLGEFSWGVYIRDLQAGTTTLISVDSSGMPKVDYSGNPSISADGRYVAFESDAALVSEDLNSYSDIYLRDTVANTTTLVSVDSSEIQAISDSRWGFISADGRYVTFGSDANNLVSGDTNNKMDIFLRDLQAGTTTRVSVDSNEMQGNGNSYSYAPAVSSDGRFVVFNSLSTNLVSGDTNGESDVFLRDTVLGITTCISIGSSGVQAHVISDSSSISPDGRYIVFQSNATNLVNGDTNELPDVFLYDIQTGTTTRVSVSSSGMQANGGSNIPSVSSNGIVAFTSWSTNLVDGDLSGQEHIFVRGVFPEITPPPLEYIPLSLPDGWQEGYLWDVWGPNATNLYAVGEGYNADQYGKPLLYHYDGNEWTEATPSLPDGWNEGFLRGVWGFGANDIFIGGSASQTTRDYLPLIYHYDGSSWDPTILSLPVDNWEAGYLSGNVWGSSANNVYAVGYALDASFHSKPLLYHYDGSDWTEAGLSLPDGRVTGSLSHIWGSSNNNVYAIGSASDGFDLPSKRFPLLYHYDDTGWTESSPSLPDGWTKGAFSGIWGSSADDVYMVGNGIDAAGNSLPLIYHYDGTSWTEVSIPLPPAGYRSHLESVWGSKADDIYAIGTAQNTSTMRSFPLVYHYDGNGWTEVSPSVPDGWTEGSLSGLWISSEDNVYTAGFGFNGSIGQPLLYQSQETCAPSLITVTNTSDSGTGSLRQAIADICPGGTINFDSSLGAYSIIDLFSPLIIDKDLTIDGSNLSNQLPLNLRGASNIQVLNSTVTISDLTIQGGYNNGDGGAIWSNGNLKLKNSTIKSSHATGNGGGIYSTGTLTIQNSAIYDNEADLDGGGIYAETPGDQVQIANSTLSQNYAHQHGGGIYTKGSTILSVLNGTIAQNSAGTMSQIMSQGQSQVTLANSIIACWFPRLNTDCYDFVQPPSITNSILGTLGEFYGLMDLADNGGRTKTMSMQANSPLVDAGDDAICASSLINNVDQRGMSRPQGSHCDIGAYELSYLTISGNGGVGGATMKYGYGLFTVADNTGKYSIKVLPGWSGTVIPSKQDYSFAPAKKDYTNLQNNQINQNYSATINTYIYPGNPAATWRISIPHGGGETDGWSDSPSISANGRYVAYVSQATNIVAGHFANDIFVYDNQTAQTSAASVHSDGTPFDCNSFSPSISADGRYVAFSSCTGGGGLLWIVYVHDRHTGIVESVSRGVVPSISADGRYVAYLSTDNSDNQPRIFVQDTLTKIDTQVSVSSTGGQPNGDSSLPSISADGRYIAFHSLATNLIDNDTNGVEDIFVYDLETAEMIRVSVKSGGIQANSASFTPSISADGRYIAFHSLANNLVSNDTNGVEDVFVHDLQTSETSRVSIGNNNLQGNQASDQAHISADGRYVAFRSIAPNLVSGDTNGAADIFIYDRQTDQTRRVSVDSNGAQANGNSPSYYSSVFSISGDGKYIAFGSDATNLVNDDANNQETDVFVHETSVLPSGYGVGVYDDTHAAWKYTGNWTTYNGSGPANNSVHYTNTVGNSAELYFHGTQFTLTYTAGANRGSFDVYVDGKLVETINAYSPSLQWQQIYVSPTYLEGDHTVRVVHTGGAGTYLNIDAIQIYDASTAVSAGLYDDTNSNWMYAGAWTTWTGSGPSNNTVHYSSTAGNYAQLQFHGTQFTLTYTAGSNRGSFEVYVDGEFVETINAYSPSLQWQQTYVSPSYLEGDHTVQFVHAGDAGRYLNIDAIQIYDASSVVSAGLYDDTNSNWMYAGAWAAWTGNGPSNNTVHYSSTVGNYAQLYFHGTQFTLTYTAGANRGSFEVYVDGQFVETINAYSPSLQWQQTYVSPSYLEGDHTVRVVHTGGAGTYLNIDAIQIYDASSVVSAGLYDDTNNDWMYAGAWAAWTGNGPYNSTVHYSSMVGNYAQLQFHGTQFTLTYTLGSNRGSFEVYVDGQFVETINAYSPSLQWQQTYVSPSYLEGDHTVQFVHAGDAGRYLNIDAIQIYDASSVVSAGLYDDTNGSWMYSGGWTAWTGNGPSNNTVHYSSTVGNYAELQFHGTQFTLTYTAGANRGSFDVYVDGEYVETINANSPSLQWQQTYLSPTYLEGDHTVRVVHTGGAGTYLNIDAIQIFP